MNCVNNRIMMPIALDTQEIALDKLKNILTIFEKKKRNLDKRKNKLDEYKKKKDLNEDQQMAVSKYQEVVSNLELVEELNSLALQQIKEAEKTLKKAKKIEKLENKRHETSLVEFVMKTSYLLDRVFENERIQLTLVSDNYIEATELQLLKELHHEVHTNSKGNWKKCSEHFQSLYEGGSKPTDFNLPDDHVLRSVTKDDILKCIEKISNIDWISSSEVEEHFDKKVEHENDETGDREEVVDVPVNEEPDQEIEEQVSKVESSFEKSPQPENPKLNFVFLHESVVQEDVNAKVNENGYDSTGYNDENVPRSNSQMSGKNTGNSNPNNNWYNADVENSVDDVFSSATQSEFMHSENSRNLKMRGQRQSNNGRFRARGSSQAAVFTNRDGPVETGNYWKSNNRGSFNSNSRYARPSRGRGRGRGNGRSENRPMNDEITTTMQ